MCSLHLKQSSEIWNDYFWYISLPLSNPHWCASMDSSTKTWDMILLVRYKFLVENKSSRPSCKTVHTSATHKFQLNLWCHVLKNWSDEAISQNWVATKIKSLYHLHTDGFRALSRLFKRTKSKQNMLNLNPFLFWVLTCF